MSEQTTNKLTQTVYENKLREKQKFMTVFIRGQLLLLGEYGIKHVHYDTWQRKIDDRSLDVGSLFAEYRSRFPKATEIYVSILLEGNSIAIKSTTRVSHKRKKK